MTHGPTSLNIELAASTTGQEALRQPVKVANHWSRGELADAAGAAAELLGWRGVVLPAVWIADAVVVPVVSLDARGWRQRWHDRLGPILDRSWWLASSDRGYATAPARPLEIDGFIVVGSVQRLRATLGRLRTTAPVAALVPSITTLDTVELTRCDYYGYSVAAADGDGIELVLDAGPWTPPGGQVHYQRKLREEQLFEVALREGQLPHDW